MANLEHQFPAENHKLALVDSWDPNSHSVRTTVTNADININVSAFTDSIKIGDGAGTTATITPVGAKKSLDVNVTDITIDAANDSIAIKNGSNQLAVNVDGSVNIKTGFSTVSVSGQITVGTTSVALLSTNPNRKYAHVTNNTGTAVFLQYGSVAVLNQGIRLNAGALFTMSGFETYTGQINVISSAPTTLIDVLEGI